MQEQEIKRRETLAIKLLCSVPHIAKVWIADSADGDGYVSLYVDGGDSPIEGADSTLGLFSANMAEMLGKALIRAAVAARKAASVTDEL